MSLFGFRTYRSPPSPPPPTPPLPSCHIALPSTPICSPFPAIFAQLAVLLSFPASSSNQSPTALVYSAPTLDTHFSSHVDFRSRASTNMAALSSNLGRADVALTEAALAATCSHRSAFSSFSGLRAAPQGTAAPQLAQRACAARRAVVRAATTVAPTFTNLRPLGDRVLVRIQEVEERTSGGILLPTSSQTKPQGGSVVAVGSGRTLGNKKVAVDVPEGGSIVYSKYAGVEIDFNGAPHLLLKEDDIVGVLASDDIADLKPLNDRVLIKVVESESKTAGGVLLTESAKEKPVVGTVIAVGPGALGEDGSRKPVDIADGATVLYAKFAGNEFKGKDGSPYVVLRSSDVMAVLS
ncbi:unnamed protein product [Closterium sp. NIES-53]